MRTTVDIDDELLVVLKGIAAQTRRSLKDLIADAIRAMVARGTTAQQKDEPRKAITFCGNGVRLGVNLDSMAELLDIMERGP